MRKNPAACSNAFAPNFGTLSSGDFKRAVLVSIGNNVFGNE